MRARKSEAQRAAKARRDRRYTTACACGDCSTAVAREDGPMLCAVCHDAGCTLDRGECQGDAPEYAYDHCDTPLRELNDVR